MTDRSRRRGADLEQAIFDVTWELLGAFDYEQVTMAAIAERAHTSKPVLYRRWPTRTELVLATLHNKVPAPRFPHTDHGDLRSDLIAVLHAVADRFTGIPPQIIESLRIAMASDAELRDLIDTQIGLVDIGPVMAEVLERAVARGEVSAKPVPDRVVRLPLDLMRLESMHGVPVPGPDKVIAEIVDQIMVPLLTAR